MGEHRAETGWIWGQRTTPLNPLTCAQRPELGLSSQDQVAGDFSGLPLLRGDGGRAQGEAAPQEGLLLHGGAAGGFLEKAVSHIWGLSLAQQQTWALLRAGAIRGALEVMCPAGDPEVGRSSSTQH